MRPLKSNLPLIYARNDKKEPTMKNLFYAAMVSLFSVAGFAENQTDLNAGVCLPGVFSDHMVLQRDQENPIWGTDRPSQKIEISIARKRVSTVADGQGNWRAKLPSLPAGGPHTLNVAGSSTVTFKNVLVGEVWFCSGQSNMQWPVEQSYGAEVEIAAANYPQIRLLTVKQLGTNVPQDNIEGRWQVCSPETVPPFSAVGYYYGQLLHQALGVPVGLIDNSWGGSTAEAWISRSALEASGDYSEMLEMWDEQVANFDPVEFEDYKKRYKAWADGGYKGPVMEWHRTVHPINGQITPANIYNGMVHPLKGYGIRGVIWYQGESNRARAAQYQRLFPFLVEEWRKEWNQGDFPFYWVQLADFGNEVDNPADDEWAELREAQTLSMDVLSNAGQAVIIDVGEGRDIHPRNKKTVANRLARWPLANDYRFDMACQSPRYKAKEVVGNKVRITLDHVSTEGLWSFDTHDVIGFSIAGEDRNFVWAKARIVDHKIVEVWSDAVAAPLAVRYGWAQNPKLNLFDRNGLPVTPFRTDDWPMVTAGRVK
jgi:sialate O-acetylesterase